MKRLPQGAIATALISFAFTLISFGPSAGATSGNSAAEPVKTIRILYGGFTVPRTLEILKSELSKPLQARAGAAVKIDVIDFTRLLPKMNPFNLKPRDFYVGFYLPYAGDPQTPPPAVDPHDAAWFDDLSARGWLPDIFLINGHQVISEGWHNERETMFLFLPTLLQTLDHDPRAREIFDHVKLAILWGCNAMTNLEPHGPQGEYLSPTEIKQIYDGGPEGKKLVIGSPAEVNTLEFYRDRLAREYGPGQPKYEYTRDPKKEKCAGPGKYDNCDITDVDRILPDSGLWDGTHRYNYPYVMKRLFPNASLVMGFSSASPEESVRAQIFQATLEQTYSDLNARLAARKKQISNLILPLVDPAAPDSLRVSIIKSLRKNWTIKTYEINRHRPSGSITPLYPDLDAGGILGEPALARGSLQYGPYEDRALAHFTP